MSKDNTVYIGKNKDFRISSRSGLIIVTFSDIAVGTVKVEADTVFGFRRNAHHGECAEQNAESEGDR